MFSFRLSPGIYRVFFARKKMNFKELHYAEHPLLLCNVWDVASAKTAEKLNFHAIATSSSAIAATFGYEDGEEMSFDELKFIVERISASINLPLSVDMETGYSTDDQAVVNHIKQLADLGVAGVNIEDSTASKDRSLIEAHTFAKKLSTIKEQLEKENLDVFLNVRTDAFLLGFPNPLEESLKRIEQYEKSGADGIFVPFIQDRDEIQDITSSTKLPVNVLNVTGLPDFNELQELGVSRISTGGSGFKYLHRKYESALVSAMDQKSFKLFLE